MTLSFWHLRMLLTALTLGCLNILFSGCTGNNTEPQQALLEPIVARLEAVTDQPVSPSPWNPIPDLTDLQSKLPKPRSASYVEADLIKAGGAVDLLLPDNRVTVTGTVEFDPAWNGPPDDSGLLAYCMYSFSIPDYDRNAQVRYTWSAPPPQISDAWICIGNWDDHKWDFYPMTVSGITDLPSMDPYIAFGGGLLLGVVVAGTDNSTLDEIRIGTQLPQPAFSFNPKYGFNPQSVSFDASSSFDPDGTIVKYEWDFDGDGTFETDNLTNPEIAHEFTSPGSYEVGLRTTDDDGIAAVLIQGVPVTESFRHTWGLAAKDVAQACAVDSHGNIYLAGNTTSAGVTSDALIAKFNALGEPVWAKAFMGSQQDGLYGIAYDGDSSIYVCGTTTSFGNTSNYGIIQKWTTDGELVWSKYWGGDNLEFLYDIANSSGDLFVVGQTLTFTNGNYDAVVLRIDPDGNLIWNRTFGGTHYDRAVAIQRTVNLFLDPVLVITGATENSDPFDTDVLYLRIDEDGTKQSAKGFGNGAPQEGTAVYAASSIGINPGKTIIAGYTDVVGGRDSLLLDASESWSKRLHYDDLGAATSIMRLGDNYKIGGTVINNGTLVYDSYLLEIDAEGTAQNLWTRDSEDGFDYVQDLCTFNGGYLIVGQSSSASGIWMSQSVSLPDMLGTWSTVGYAMQSVVGATYQNATATVMELEGGVVDEGAGAEDCYFELRQIQ